MGFNKRYINEQVIKHIYVQGGSKAVFDYIRGADGLYLSNSEFCKGIVKAVDLNQIESIDLIFKNHGSII